MKNKNLENTGKMDISKDIERVTADNEDNIQPDLISSKGSDVSIYKNFIISKPLTSKEAVYLLKGFDMYRKNPAYEMGMESICESREEVFYNQGIKERSPIKNSIRGYSYTNYFGITWEIKECRGICREFEYKDYCIDIIINPTIYMDNKVDNRNYDGNLLKSIMDALVEESKEISPLFEDFSSYFLKHISYEVDITIDRFPLQILTDLQNRYSLPANYREWEMFSGDSSKNKSSKNTGYMDSRAVKVCLASHDTHTTYYKINRKFNKNYSLKELIENDSAATKLIIEQMLSDAYMRRSASTYLKTAVMGGSYYSMPKATEIINSSSLTEEKKGDLIQALVLVDQHKGIRNAKIVHKDNDEALCEFNNNLHELVELGVNPVTIPTDYNIEGLYNPILKLDGQYNSNWKEASSYIEVEEEIGYLKNAPCRITQR